MSTTAYMRIWREKNREKWKKYHREYQQRWRAKHGTKKDASRKKVIYAIKRGDLIKLPCEVCGEIKVEAHHNDYRSPLKIVWLCQPHHRERDVLMGKRKS